MTADRTYLHPRLGRMEQVASIRRAVLDDGKGRGLRVAEVDNGSGLRFDVFPDRGLDIGRASYKGTPLAWLSCNGDVAPHFYEPSGIEWLRTWNGGLLTGCGLSNVGGPAEAGGERHGLHGRLSHIPAEAVNTEAAWAPDGSYTLTVSGQLRQCRVFGENLSLTRRIATAYGSSALTVSDTISNGGFKPAPLMLLYHINLGWPLVDEGARIEAAPHEVLPQNGHAAAGLAEWASLTAPLPGFREQVYYHAIPAGPDGLAAVRLANPRLGLALEVAYRTAELPHLIQWKMMGEGEYVLGLEPATCYPEGPQQAAQRGQLLTLEPGQTIETFLRLTACELG